MVDFLDFSGIDHLMGLDGFETLVIAELATGG